MESEWCTRDCTAHSIEQEGGKGVMIPDLLTYSANEFIIILIDIRNDTVVLI